MAADERSQQTMTRNHEILRGAVDRLLEELKNGVGDKDKRRQVEEWMRTLSEKYPEFSIEHGLREYYVAEATRLRRDFDAATDLVEKLSLARAVESFLDRASEYDRRLAEKQ